ncbi:helix-turn-helix transcriptional regulator [Streptomyces scabiei]|uniref:Transcriptional repressor DicA n=1 Tax=Streptomyces scabiei TaxID=1930 RepID=A0A100JU18_STRSC|nr:helix-turn-helix transcriptional regulator [Streptomyces scabiei]GAQ65684.1 transcriptional repressor DicA [Streptomyces scabiei]
MARRRQRLAERRQAVGLTQEVLAERLGVDRSTIVRWEAGTASPQPWMRPRLATELKVTVDELDDLLTQESEPGGPAAEVRQRALDPSQTDLTTVVELRSEFEELAARYDRTPSASLLAKGGDNSA